MADARQSVLLDAPRGVDVASIEQELTRLWKRASEPTDGDGTAAVMRACSLNLIVVSEDPGRIGGIADMVGEVTIEHPGRIILATVEPQSSVPSLEAWISARCSLPVPGGRQVCCEQITINAGGADARKVPSVITSLLVPDVPTYLLWKARVGMPDQILLPLAHVSDRVLIDASEELAPIPVLLLWSRFVRSQDGRASFGDLSWTHLTLWRNVLAQLFQPPEMRSHFPLITGVHIAYSATPSPRHSGLSQSLLLAGWLTNRLQWGMVHPFREEGHGVYTCTVCNSSGAETEICLRERVPARNMPGGIEAVAMSTSSGVAIDVAMGEEHTCIRSIVEEKGERKKSVWKVRDQGESELVTRELEVLDRDELYEASLLVLADMLGGDAP